MGQGIRTKQVLVVRKDLNMRKGKLAGQVAHAALKAVLDAGVLEGDGRRLVIDLGGEDSPLRRWVFGKFTKVVVSVNSEQELLDIYRRGVEAGIAHCMIITDCGQTEFHDVPTKTAVALGPDHADRIDAVSGHLPLL